jgi:hypothetical protein
MFMLFVCGILLFAECQMAFVASPWEFVPIDLGYCSASLSCYGLFKGACSLWLILYILMYCFGFQLVPQACLAIFDLYTSYIWSKKKNQMMEEMGPWNLYPNSQRSQWQE